MSRNATIRSRSVNVQGGGGGNVNAGTAVWSAFGGRDDGLISKASVSLDTIAQTVKPRFDAIADLQTRHKARADLSATAEFVSQAHTIKPRLDASASINQIQLEPDPLSADEDTYFDQAAANAANGGAVTLLAKQTAPLQNNARISYVAFDRS